MVLFGCSDEASNSKKDGEKEQEQEKEVVQEKNTFISGKEGQSTQEIKVGESAFFIFPKTDFTEERKVEFIVHGIDYINGEDNPDYTFNSSYDYLVLDFEVKNIGEEKISSYEYPSILLHNSSGQEVRADLKRNNSSHYYFTMPDLTPGGFSRGLAIHELKDGEEIAEILFEISGYDNLKLDVPFTLDISDMNKLASDEPTTLYDELELLREEYLLSRFDNFIGEELSSNRISMNKDSIENYNLIIEPTDLKLGGWMSQDKYFAEFIRDENNRIIGVRFTKQ